MPISPEVIDLLYLESQQVNLNNVVASFRDYRMDNEIHMGNQNCL